MSYEKALSNIAMLMFNIEELKKDLELSNSIGGESISTEYLENVQQTIAELHSFIVRAKLIRDFRDERKGTGNETEL